MSSVTEVEICENLWKSLQNCTDSFRTLYGWREGTKLSIISSCTSVSPFPNGYTTLGVFSSKSNSDVHTLISRNERRLESIRECLELVDLTHFVFLTTVNVEPSLRLVSRDSLSEIEDVSLKVTPISQESGVLLRCRMEVPLTVQYPGDAGKFKDELQRVIKNNCQFMASPSCMMFSCNDTLMRFEDSSTSILDFLKSALDKKIKTDSIEEVEVSAMKLFSGDDAVSTLDAEYTPVISINKKTVKCFNIPLDIDVITFVPFTTNVSIAVAILAKTLYYQALESAEPLSKGVSNNQLTPVVPLHFRPGNSYITSLVPGGAPTTAHKDYLHSEYLLPKDRPLFSGGQNIFFSKDTPVYCDVLLNTHKNLANPAKATKVATVKGNYLYYHYMQQKFDDKGWGCAYRSLQTLCSWFKLQGYTEAEVPGHKKIQETLVEIGDKQSNFIGSKQWIGSQEVGFVLNQIMKVDSKTIFVNSGGDLPSKADDLIRHFETHGTPVMIGGGQLAHTIIGISVNEETEDTHFLILDPHYTGSEDLSTINGKGWCNWKPSSFWDKTSFYNMCLPQVPSNVY